jgi:cysteine-rich secretory family protein
MRCLLVVVFVAILLAAADLIRVDSPAEAAGGGYASRCGGGKIFLYATEQRLLTMHNNTRENHGLKPFCVHPALQSAARAHSKDMIQHDYFSHDTRGRNEDPCAHPSLRLPLVLLHREHRIQRYSGRRVPLLDAQFHPPP